MKEDGKMVGKGREKGLLEVKRKEKAFKEGKGMRGCGRRE